MSGDNEAPKDTINIALRLYEISDKMGQIKSDIGWIKSNLDHTSKILDMHDKRLSQVEGYILIIKERRSIFFKFGKFLLSIFGWKI